jgi:hypothetical protein
MAQYRAIRLDRRAEQAAIEASERTPHAEREFIAS